MNERKKIRLKVSIIEYVWKEEFRDGLKAGDLEGQTTYDEEEGRRKDVVYCQKNVYPMSDVKMYVVEFEKNADEVFIDWDETKAEDDDILYERRDKTYENADIKKEYGFFGSYVMEVKKEEIVRICEISYDDELEIKEMREV